MRRLRFACLATSAVILAGCGRGLQIRTEGLSDRAFADDQAQVAFTAVADGVARFRVLVDGSAALEADAVGGRASVVLPRLAAGRHAVVVEAEGVPGVAVERELFVDRLPDTHVDGIGSTGEDWLVTRSGAQPTSVAGLSAGRLTVTWVGTDGAHAFSRVLTEDGVFAEVSNAPAPWAGWVDAWEGDHGTLHVGPVAAASTANDFPGVRGFGFSPGGSVLLGVDEGTFVSQAPFAVASRIAPTADSASFVGVDVVSLAREPDGARAHATLAWAPDYAPVTVGPTVAQTVTANPTAREITLRKQPTATTPGGLLAFTPDAAGAEALFGEVSSWGYSPSGSFLAAVVSAGTNGAGTLALATRLQPTTQTATWAGDFVGAGFDPLSRYLYGLELDGTLSRFDLASFPPTRAPFATDVARFALLENRAVVWEARDGTMWVQLVNGTTFPAGTLDPAKGEVVFAPDSSAVAFTVVGAGARRPVRRVDLTSGDIADFGNDAQRPAFLAGGALAWAETRADAEAGGIANEDLWLFPSFPASAVGGARMLAERVKSDEPFEVSADGHLLVALTGLPRRGNAWSAHAGCFDDAAHAVDLGPADPDLRVIHVRGDDRVLWFSPPGIVSLARCR